MDIIFVRLVINCKIGKDLIQCHMSQKCNVCNNDGQYVFDDDFDNTYEPPSYCPPCHEKVKNKIPTKCGNCGEMKPTYEIYFDSLYGYDTMWCRDCNRHRCRGCGKYAKGELTRHRYSDYCPPCHKQQVEYDKLTDGLFDD